MVILNLNVIFLSAINYIDTPYHDSNTQLQTTHTWTIQNATLIYFFIEFIEIRNTSSGIQSTPVQIRRIYGRFSITATM